MKEVIAKVIEDSKCVYYSNTSMALDIICERLFYNYGIDATFSGRSIFVDDARVASIRTFKDGANLVGIYDYKIL